MTNQIQELREKAAALRAKSREILARPNATTSDLQRVAELGNDADQSDLKAQTLLENELRSARLAALPNLLASTGGAIERPQMERWIEERVLNSTTGSGTAITLEQWRPTILQALAAQSVSFAAGLQQVFLTDGAGDTLYLPTITNNGTATITGTSAGAFGTATASDATISRVTVGFDRVNHFTLADNALLADSPPGYLTGIVDSMIKSVSLKADAIVFQGGSAVTGIQPSAGGTVSMGANGGSITNLDPFMQAIGTALTGNAAPNAIVMHPRTWTTLLQIKTASGDTTPLVYTGVTSGVAGAVPYAIAGLPVFVSTNAMSIGETAGTVTTTSSALVLDTRGIYLALRVPTEGAEPITAVADRSYAFQENQTALLASMRVGVAVPQGAAVTRISGILA